MLELRLSELSDLGEDNRDLKGNDGDPKGSNTIDDLVVILYTKVVKLVDKAIQIYAINKQLLLQPKTRKK